MKKWSRTRVDASENRLQQEWPENLRNCFDFVTIDEAHMAKTLGANIHISLEWLYASKHIIVIATPMSNGVEDFRGYMPFLEFREADEWWSPESLADMDFDEDANLYDLADDHPAAKLQLTRRAVKDWIYALRVDPVTKGARLQKIWKRVMIRRTNSSMISFENGRRIGVALSEVQAAFIKCTHFNEEKTKYYAMEDALIGNLIVEGSSTETRRKLKWSLATHRNLSLLSMWMGLLELDTKFNLKAVNLKATLEEKIFFLEWFRDNHTRPEMKNPGPLLLDICNGSPKVRALLRNVRSQVSTLCLCFCQRLPILYFCQRLPVLCFC